MKWYVGVIKNRYGIGPHPLFIIKDDSIVSIVFPYGGKVTEKRFGHVFVYAYGPYKTFEEAIKVARWQGYAISVQTTWQIKQLIKTNKGGVKC